MKRSWLNRKPEHKSLRRGGKRLRRTSGLSTTRKKLYDDGQRRTPSASECDSMMSLEVRRRGSWICVRCRRSFAAEDRRRLLGSSHFFNKGTCAAVRYDPRNLDPLCHECHTGRDGWEYQKSGAYLTYMIGKLGWEEYERLRVDAMVSVKLDDAKASFLEGLKGGTLWQGIRPSWASTRATTAESWS